MASSGNIRAGKASSGNGCVWGGVCEAFSSNAVSICHACGLGSIIRLERSRRFRLEVTPPVADVDGTAPPSKKTKTEAALLTDALEVIKGMLHDKMTEEEYLVPIQSFSADVTTEGVRWRL